jgi:hypothetical protein
MNLAEHAALAGNIPFLGDGPKFWIQSNRRKIMVMMVRGHMLAAEQAEELPRRAMDPS